MNCKCALVTSLIWIAGIAIYYGYAVTNQIIVIPNQIGYMEVRHNDLTATPSNFEVSHRPEQSLDDLVKNVIK